jgi:hypothetical protein
MNMPGFTAEVSLYKTSGQYHAATQVELASGIVYPAISGAADVRYPLRPGLLPYPLFTCETYCAPGDIDLLERCYLFRRLVSTTVVRRAGCLH